MQLPTQFRTWGEFFAYLVVLAIGGSGWFAAWKNRKKPDADIQKTLAETHRIVVDDAVRVYIEAKATIKELREENEQLQRDLMTMHMEVKQLRGNGNSKAR